jgi:hypothetical protein
MADTDTFHTTRDAHEEQADSIYVSVLFQWIMSHGYNMYNTLIH